MKHDYRRVQSLVLEIHAERIQEQRKEGDDLEQQAVVHR